ncbi:hypothetical protein BGZ49_000515, partial [Haplosporangium sp. Z 27]
MRIISLTLAISLAVVVLTTNAAPTPVHNSLRLFARQQTPEEHDCIDTCLTNEEACLFDDNNSFPICTSQYDECHQLCVPAPSNAPPTTSQTQTTVDETKTETNPDTIDEIKTETDPEVQTDVNPGNEIGTNNDEYEDEENEEVGNEDDQDPLTEEEPEDDEVPSTDDEVPTTTEDEEVPPTTEDE